MRLKIVGKGKIGRIFLERFKDEIVEQVNYSKELNNYISCDVVIDFSHPDNLNDKSIKGNAYFVCEVEYDV